MTEAVTLGPGRARGRHVEMNQPGVWILGATDDKVRDAGLGVVVEYANQHREPQWVPPAKPAMGLFDFWQRRRRPRRAGAKDRHGV